ncbi:SRPBCC family protein [Streptomyces sp. I05A-00742]|uniref:aromatase/cyclase n=1 Tax=Streptomyces sp. I05A-00742 TaxID=2732853 RepID=UPI001489E080|nr:SRPBCC family protein [Streptomyces sp. I05A-00742]
MSAQPPEHHVEHEVTVRVPAAAAFSAVENVLDWPVLLPPMVHVEPIGTGGSDGPDRIKVWASAGGDIKTWTTGRAVDHRLLRVTFVQEASPPPLAAMSSEWSVEPRGERECAVRIRHRFRLPTGMDERLAPLRTAMSDNTAAELRALKGVLERRDTADTVRWEESARVRGGVAEAYAFLRAPREWPGRVAGVADVTLTEPAPDVQIVATNDSAAGQEPRTACVRVLLPDARLVFKSLAPGPGLTAHTGEWRLEPADDGTTTVVCRHTAVLTPDAVAAGRRDEVLAEAGGASRALLGALGSGVRVA